MKDNSIEYNIVKMTNRNSYSLLLNIRENPDYLKLYGKYREYVETLLPSESFEINEELMTRLFVLKCIDIDTIPMHTHPSLKSVKSIKTNPFELLSSIYNTYMLKGFKFRIYAVKKISRSTMYCPIEIELINRSGYCMMKASKYPIFNNADVYVNSIDEYTEILKTSSIDPVLNKFHNFFSFISKRKEFVIDMLNNGVKLGQISETGYSKLITFSKKYSISNIENFYKLSRYDYNNDDITNPKLIKLTKLFKSLHSNPRFHFAMTINAIHIVVECGIGVINRKSIVSWRVSVPSQNSRGRSIIQKDIETNMINIFFKILDEFDATDILISKLEIKLLSNI